MEKSGWADPDNMQIFRRVQKQKTRLKSSLHSLIRVCGCNQSERYNRLKCYMKTEWKGHGEYFRLSLPPPSPSNFSPVFQEHQSNLCAHRSRDIPHEHKVKENNKELTLELIHRNPIPLFYIHTSITLYNNFNAFKKKKKKIQSENKSWRFTMMSLHVQRLVTSI